MHLITDFHTHILPEMDDGAATIGEAVAMLQQLQAQGVQRVVFTPHYYPYENNVSDFVAKRDSSAAVLLEQKEIAQDTQYLVAAEVRLHEALLHYEQEEIESLCIPSTNHILLEFPYGTSITSSILHQVSSLMYNFNCTPILAHIERYLSRINMRDLQSLLEDGCKLQINLNSWETLPFFQRRQLMKLIRNGWVDCCGSDCHNLTTRPPLYQASAERLKKAIGEEIADTIITASSIF